jgi:hypothetical protein
MKGECRAFALDRLYLYIAFVQHHNLFTQALANATFTLFGAEERDKDLFNYFLRHTGAIVGHLNYYLVFCSPISKQSDLRICTRSNICHSKSL